jgi:hypothetical protein
MEDKQVSIYLSGQPENGWKLRKGKVLLISLPLRFFQFTLSHASVVSRDA